MASTMIHVAIANEINKKIGRDYNKLLIGAIAPDLSKIIGKRKEKSHFIPIMYSDIPDVSLFLKKYKKHLKDDFVLGYYIHLCTDYLWFKYFIPEIYSFGLITKLDGTRIACTQRQMLKYIYDDYTNLNIQLIDEYELNLKIFYNDLPNLKYIIDEIEMNKLNLLIDKISVIIENTKERKEYIFDISNIKQFIDISVKLILAKIEELGIVINE